MKIKITVGIVLFLILTISGVLSYNYYQDTYASCKTISGKYVISSIGLGPKDKKKEQYCHLPVFTFMKDGTVKIKPDFYFPLFKDSIFTYRLDTLKGTLFLKGKNVTHKIICEPQGGENYNLYPDTPYLRYFSLIKEHD